MVPSTFLQQKYFFVFIWTQSVACWLALHQWRAEKDWLRRYYTLCHTCHPCSRCHRHRVTYSMTVFTAMLSRLSKIDLKKNIYISTKKLKIFFFSFVPFLLIGLWLHLYFGSSVKIWTQTMGLQTLFRLPANTCYTWLWGEGSKCSLSVCICLSLSPPLPLSLCPSPVREVS